MRVWGEGLGSAGGRAGWEGGQRGPVSAVIILERLHALGTVRHSAMYPPRVVLRLFLIDRLALLLPCSRRAARRQWVPPRRPWLRRRFAVWRAAPIAHARRPFGRASLSARFRPCRRGRACAPATTPATTPAATRATTPALRLRGLRFGRLRRPPPDLRLVKRLKRKALRRLNCSGVPLRPLDLRRRRTLRARPARSRG